MNSVVDKVIADKEAEKRRRLDFAKEELAEKLMREDYFDREYAEPDEKLKHIYEKEDLPDGGVRYYKKVPLKLTDGEFEALRGYYPSDKFEPEKPTIVGVLQILAWAIFVLGVIIGVWVGGDAIIWAVLGAIPATAFFLALAEIIKRLNNIEKLLKKDK